MHCCCTLLLLQIEDWLKRGTLDARSVRVFVLDEADNLMTGQFGQQILRIAKYMR
jgi:superfamily II DNA/RNA helicase